MNNLTHCLGCSPGVYLLKDINPISSSPCVTGEALLRTLVTLFTYLRRGPNILLELREYSICHQLWALYYGGSNLQQLNAKPIMMCCLSTSATKDCHQGSYSLCNNVKPLITKWCRIKIVDNLRFPAVLPAQCTGRWRVTHRSDISLDKYHFPITHLVVCTSVYNCTRQFKMDITSYTSIKYLIVVSFTRDVKHIFH